VLSGGSRKSIVPNPAHDQNNSEGINRDGDVKNPRAPKREKQLLRNPSGDLPLKGIRVLDLGWIISAPLSTRYLAVMGAEVIKVGSKVRSEFEARTYNQSKLSCTINVSVPEGVELVKRLVAESQVVVENLSTGAIDRMGLGYGVLRVVRPDIIMVSSSGLGHTGPDKDLLAYGSLLQHYTGWNSITGGGGIAADPWVALQLAMVTVAALNYRSITGHGQYIDFSMVESLLSAMAEPILEYQITGRIPEPTGNKDMEHVPHGIYQCLGERSWVAIAVTNETQWGALCGLIGRPDLAMKRDLLYSNSEEGFSREVEDAISRWTAQYEDYEAARLFQMAGVPAGPSLDSTRVPCDPQLLKGGYFTPFETGDGEAGLQPGVPWRFSDDQSPRLVEAPVLGQDNEYVFKEILGISEQEVNQLMDQKVIY
jgi:benzylsuccinate CoA-transferase BbsF subunit